MEHASRGSSFHLTPGAFCSIRGPLLLYHLPGSPESALAALCSTLAEERGSPSGPQEPKRTQAERRGSPSGPRSPPRSPSPARKKRQSRVPMEPHRSNVQVGAQEQGKGAC
eukprot:308952-Pelagomonas_calceolata.AAC.4